MKQTAISEMDSVEASQCELPHGEIQLLHKFIWYRFLKLCRTNYERPRMHLLLNIDCVCLIFSSAINRCQIIPVRKC